MNLNDDLHTRWLPSSEQMKMADALLAVGYTAERDGWIETLADANSGEIRPVEIGRGERGVYTAHLLLNKEYGWWTEDVQLVFLDGVFLTREAVLEYVHAQAEKHYRKHKVKLTGGWAWHFGVGEAAVWEDICTQLPEKPKAFLVWEDDLAVAFRPVEDRAAAMKFLQENIDDRERFSATFCELHPNGTTWAEKINPDHIDWLQEECEFAQRGHREWFCTVHELSVIDVANEPVHCAGFEQ